MSEPILKTELDGLKLLRRGKVRDIYDMGENLLIVSTDRISAFDCVMPNGIPNKGKVLTQLAKFWFDMTKDIVPNHIISCDVDDYPEEAKKHADVLKGRSMRVKKADMQEVECIVRGYLAGSGWKDYQNTGKVCGIALPEGLKQAEKLPKVIFTPSTKAASGHDENISEEKMMEIVGEELGTKLRDTSIAIYEKALAHAESRGIILADTKFEFGKIGDDLLLIDEILTPDSSRFWPMDGYQVGSSPQSFDKQFVRDYLETLDWDKTPPAPELPPDIVAKTEAKYLEAFERITGNKLEV
jgi:phosphoribosylaminoimidazole-succinocarboxamide synthase